MLNNKTNQGKSFEAIRTKAREKGAGGADLGEFSRRVLGAGKKAATSMTIGSGPPPKGVPK